MTAAGLAVAESAMTDLGIIGGSGLNNLEELEIVRQEVVPTPFGEPSAPLIHGLLHGRRLVFLPRHGAPHTIPPHLVNYRANIWALKQIGIERIIGVAAVGGIAQSMAPGCIVIPDQLIDYTYDRDQTFFDRDLTQVTHIDFTEPYCEALRQQLISAAQSAGIEVAAREATYGATQGPRLETRKEIDRMERDGCDLVGMTGMPEAALARELDLCYACCALVANRAAGRGNAQITMQEIERNLAAGIGEVLRLLSALAARL